MIILKPNPGQQEFALRQPYTIFEILYGGARGGGKTYAGLIWLTEYVDHPRFQGLVIRRDAVDLSDWIERARYMFSGLGVTITGSPAILRFPSGAIIRTGHLSDDTTYTKYMGHEYQKILIEELTQIPTVERYLKLISSCRTTIAELRPQIFATTNPGGVGHLWVKERFVDGGEHNQAFIGEDGLRRIYIPATIDDNPYLNDADPDYVQRIEALRFTDNALYRAWRFGEWNIFVGQVFKEWRLGSHVIDSLPIRLEDCQLYIGFDWGYNDPGSAHWIAVTPENDYGVKHYYVYREIYANEKRPSWWAEEIGAVVKDEPIEALIMPHDTYSNLGGSLPIVEQFRRVFDEQHVRLTMLPSESQSHRAKMGRIAITHEALSEAPDGRPYMQVHRNCRNLIRTLPALPYDEHKPEEIDDKAEDHAWDSLSYALYRINDGKSIIVTSDSSKPKRKESFIITEEGIAEGLNVNIGKAIEESGRDYRDWRHL